MSGTLGPVTIAVTAFGESPIGRIIRRGGARARDTIFVTGTIGDAALGLLMLQDRLTADAAAASFLVDRYRLPRPRTALGPGLIGIATAGLDISDGLVADLRHLCEASRLSAVVEAQRVPLSAAAQAAIRGETARLATALTGGDDYEILFTASPLAAGRIAELSRKLEVPITAIGHMQAPPAGEPPGLVVLDEAGRPLALAAEGWTHFGGSG